MHRFVSTALIMLSLGAGILLADDWSTAVGGHADRMGHSGGAGPGFATLLWKGGGNSTNGEQVVVEGGRVFVARSNDDLVYGYDLATGLELWRRNLPAGSLRAHVSGVRDGQLYVSRSSSGTPDYFYALDVVDGSTFWRSQDPIDENFSESLSFSSEGDPIVGGMMSIIRIDRATGRTVWNVSRSCSGWGACGVAVSGSRLFASNFVPSGIGVDAYDVATGAKLYSSGALASGGSQNQVFTGPGGRVFAPFVWNQPGDALVALSDSGTALTQIWRSPLPWLVFAAFAVGPEGSIYSFSTSHEILRLDPATGAIRNRSMVLPSSSGFIVRLATDLGGFVYLTLEDGTPTAGVYSFNADLSLRWKDTMPNPWSGGLALARDRTLLACGASGDLRAYRDSPSQENPFRVDPRTSGTANGNGVLEPGETVSVEPSFRNLLTFPVSMTALLSSPAGPPGATYTTPDGFADFGFTNAGSVSNCFDKTGNCFTISVSNPVTRPVQHWDITATETVSGDHGNTRYLTFHIGKSFADVPTTSPQYKFIETIFHNNITGGCTTGNFCPNDNVSRAQMAVFLLASKHGPTWTPPPAKGTVFTDVPANSFAAAWIERMPLEGISTGCGVGIYCPTANTTRAQMSVFLLRAQGGMSYNPPACTVAPFTDVPCSTPYAAWIAELVRRNIAGGCGNGKYCPDDPVTRGQMAVFLTTTFGLQLYAP